MACIAFALFSSRDSSLAAWSAGALFQALSIPFVQGALVSACVEELLLERVTAKRQQQQQQLQQQ
eukprot:scaffold60808_cov18-Tisochrysis_lutea.AAC.1